MTDSGSACIVVELAAHPTLPHHDHAVAHRQHLGEVGRDDQHGDPVPGEVVDQPVDVGLRTDVDATRRLVEHEHFGRHVEPLRQHRLLLVAAREVADRRVERGRPDVQAIAERGGSRPLGIAVDEAEPAPERGDPRQRDVRRDALGQRQPELAPVLGHVRDPGAERVAGGRDLHLTAVDRDRAGVRRSDAEEREPDVGAAGPDETGQADHLPGANVEAHIFERAGATEARDPERHVAWLVAGPDEEVADLTPDHLPDEEVLGHLAHWSRRDPAAVAEHGDAIGDPEDLVETVADEQHRDAAVSEPVDLAEQALRLVRRQRGGRLVHDQDPGVERDRLGDLDGLLGTDGQRAGWRPRIEVDVE